MGKIFAAFLPVSEVLCFADTAFHMKKGSAGFNRQSLSLSLSQTRGVSAQKDLNFTLKRKKKPAQPGKREGKSNQFISKFSQISPKKINSCLWDGFCYERLNYIM